MGVVYGRVAFNDGADCLYHSERATVSDAIAQQSAARGMTYQEWQQKVAGKG
jgi:hypothetical protein